MCAMSLAERSRVYSRASGVPSVPNYARSRGYKSSYAKAYARYIQLNNKYIPYMPIWRLITCTWNIVPLHCFVFRRNDVIW